MLLKLFSKLTPDSIKRNSLAYTRAKNILGAAIIAMIAVPFYAALYYYLDAPVAAVVILLEGIFIAIGVVILKYNASIFVAREIIVISLTVCLGWLSYSLGGINSAITFWLVVPPLAAFFFGGSKSATFLSLFCIFFVILLFVLESLNIPLPVFSISDPLLLKTISIIGFMMVTICLAYFFERGKVEDALESYKINKALREANIKAENLRMEADQANLAKLKAVRQSENKFKSILEGTPDAMIIANQEGKIIMVNAQTEKLFGYTKAEIINKHVEFLIPKRYPNNNDDYSFNPRPKVMEVGLELCGLNKAGNKFPVEISVAPVEITEGVLALATIRDITEKKNIEKILIDKNIQLENANLAKDQFLSHMSHELRTPLNGIITMTQLLMTSDLTKDQRNQLDIISESEEHLLFVINQILDFEKVKSGAVEAEKVVFNFRDLIKNTIVIYETKAKVKNIQLNCKIDNRIPESYVGDQVKIRQTLSNILDNAIKFTPLDGKVDVAISLHRKNEDTDIVLFAVTDTGIGITPEVRERLFKSFSQGDFSMSRKYGGTGLGLAISKSLVEVMGGNIDVESTDTGTRFYFTIPLIESKQLFVNKDKSSATNPISDGESDLHILLAEDNKLNQRTLKIILEKFGYHVTIASDGNEALAALKKYPFDLILMDCQMPNLDGYATTREIRKQEKGGNKHIPIIGVTAHAMKNYKDKCVEAGMNDYISKPFNIVELYNLIKSYTAK